ncbi:hypothetical protein QWY85_09920 [Neolewinella lacunae]|uniref:Uncharacterized protein n=1 Tax=Neolewinella lacunae TaxID=1517758 RepID=A0A923T8G8_9BACT|nr:hypothetical protein [Neolewinella lacunae]MBC6993943.1 hypothetical protein [Neolewinella lacunae]MDN3634976.1 hypothetical protein [Neolewinella lacunae]
MIPPFLLGLLFLLLAWWMRQKAKAWHRWAIAPLVTGALILLFTFTVKYQDVAKVQARHDLDTLLEELRRPDLWEANDLTNREELLFLASTGSGALYRMLEHAPERKPAIDSTLRQLAEWVSDRGNFRQWRGGTDLDREVFFLAHAGAVLGHYQLATREESYAASFQKMGEHLGKRLQRARYKHLISRDDEEYFRPADNAAALYTLSLYESYYATQYLEPSFTDWANYLTTELYFEESRLPCAAFSATNRCQLGPNATATGLYIAYRAAAAPAQVDSDIPWQEWLHYFKRTSLSPFTLRLRSNMRAGEPVRFCNQGAAPLDCEYYESAVGLWAAAEYGAGYSYFRFFGTEVLRRWLQSKPNYAAFRPPRRAPLLIRVSLRTLGEAK